MIHLKENIAPVKKEKELLKADQGLKLKIISVLELTYQTLLQVQSLAHVTHTHEHLESQGNYFIRGNCFLKFMQVKSLTTL